MIEWYWLFCEFYNKWKIYSILKKDSKKSFLNNLLHIFKLGNSCLSHDFSKMQSFMKIYGPKKIDDHILSAVIFWLNVIKTC